MRDLSKGPLFKVDSSLADRAYQILSEAEGPVGALDLARDVFHMRHLSKEMAERLMETLLTEDVRFARTPDGRWVLRRYDLGRMDLRKMPLAEAAFVAVDVEITGVGREARIIELGAVKIEKGGLGARFSSLINPGRPLPAKLMAPVRITNAMLQGAPRAEEVFPRFFRFLADAILVAHNAHFDIRCLNQELSRYARLQLIQPVIDTLPLARHFFTGLDNYSLGQLAIYFGVPYEDPHRALPDALALAKVFVKILSRLQKEGVATLQDLQPFFLKNIS